MTYLESLRAITTIIEKPIIESSPMLYPAITRPELPPIEEAVFGIVYEYTGIDKEKMINGKQYQPIVYARYFSMYLLYLFGELGYAPIGKIFNKDHATAIHGVKKIIEQSEVDPEFNIKRKKMIVEMQKMKFAISHRRRHLLEVTPIHR